MESQEGTALLEWINSFPLSHSVESLKELRDGHIIWTVLRDIDPDFFTGELPEGPKHTGQWVSQWQNLKHISKRLSVYITDYCGHSYPEDHATADLKAIASDTAPHEIVKFMKLSLLAAISSPKAMEYISRMPYLSTSTQTSLKEIIEDSTSATVSDNEGSIYRPSPFPAHLSAAAPNMALDITLELHNRLARLQEHNDTLQERLIEAEDCLQANGFRHGVDGDTSMEQMKYKIQQQDEIIGDQEHRLFEYQTNAEAMQKHLEKLKVSSGKSQKLRDELDEIRIDRDNLAKRANTADKYKQKLQALTGLEKRNESLQYELDDMRDQFKAYDKVRQQVASLQLTIEEYKRILPKIEQDRHDSQMMKRKLEFDNATLAQRCEKANEQRSRDQETIADLNGKISDLSVTQSPSFCEGGLESEISHVNKTDEQISRLELQNQQSHQSTDKLFTQTVLQQQLLDSTQDKLDRLEIRVTKLAQEKLEAEAALATIRGGDPTEGTEVYHRMRADRDAVQQRNVQLQADYELLQQHHADLQGDAGKVQRTPSDSQEVMHGAIPDDEVIGAGGREQEAKHQEHIKKQGVQIAHLQAQLQKNQYCPASNSTSASGNDESEVKALKQELDMLKRENKLMQSAYHDLGSRLQMNNVILQRRIEAPKSWITKQRRLVEQAALGGRF